MHLLPRSRRGTWLLAGAVWCAACAGLWCTLPVTPRAEFPLDNESPDWGLLGLGPDGDSAVIQRFIDYQPPDRMSPDNTDLERKPWVTVELVDLHAGQKTHTPCPTKPGTGE